MKHSPTSELNFPAAKNAAPLAPFLALKDKTLAEAKKDIADHYVVKQIKRKYDDLMKRDKSVRRSLIQAGEINSLFIQGEQVLTFNHFTKMPQIVTANKKDPQHIKSINKLQSFSTETIDKWRTSKSDVIVSPFSNSDIAQAQAAKANAVVDYLESRFFKEWFEQQTSITAQCFGWYGWRVKPDYTAKSFHAFREITEDKPTQIGKGWGRCSKCGYTGDKVKEVKTDKESPANLCPECENERYEYDSPATILMPKTKRREKVFLPEIVCELHTLPSTVWDLSKRWSESGYSITERKIKENALRRILNNIRFPEGESGNQFGLDVIDKLAKSGAAINGISDSPSKSEDNSKEIVLTEMHLDADEAFDIQIGGGEKTVEGVKLPKGKRLSDIYPNGCVIIGINGMALIIGIYGENHKDLDSDGVFHMKALSGAGRGIDDTIETQKLFNRGFSQINNFMRARATPAILTAENAIEPKYRPLLSRPDAVIPIKIQNFPEFRSLDQIIRPLQGESVPGDLINVTFSNMEDLLQRQFQITNFAGGNPRANNNTLGGAQILEANGDSLQSPRLALKAEAQLDTLRKGFYQWCEVTPFARFLPYKKQSKAGSYGEEISGEEVNAEYQWSYVPGSEAPKNRYTEAQKKANFFGMFGGVAGWLEAKQLAPKEVGEIEKDYDVNFASDATDSIGEMCRLRFERAKKEVAKAVEAQQQPDYMAILYALDPAMLVTEPALEEQAKWFQNLLMTPEGAKMNRPERGLASTFVVALKELAKGQAIETQTDVAEVEMAAQKVQMEEQQRQQQTAMAAQAEAEQMTAAEAAQAQEGQMVAEGLKVLNDNDQAAQAQAASAESQDKEMLIRAAEIEHEKELKAADIVNQQVLAERGNA